MTRSELRIGSLIDRGDYHCKVTGITEDGIMTEPINYEGERFVEQITKPIPLTEEWLVKFGFDKKAHREGLSIILENTLGYKNGRTYFKSWCILESQPKHVHQLQNLYFALTGKELEE
jgi:hypothetical protein